MFPKFEVCTVELAAMRQNSAIVLFLKKPVTLKNPTPPTVFEEYPSNFAKTLTAKLQRAARSPILNFHPRSLPKKFKKKLRTIL